MQSQPETTTQTPFAIRPFHINVPHAELTELPPTPGDDAVA